MLCLYAHVVTSQIGLLPLNYCSETDVLLYYHRYRSTHKFKDTAVPK
jgi:hypothetical protein